MREDELVEKISAIIGRTGFSNRADLLGIGDDAAVWRAKSGNETILTCDWFLEDTHFLRDKHPADAVGWKCLARAISDVAAMGGAPVCFLLSLALPPALSGCWLDEFLRGLRRATKRFACPLAGGDTTRKGQVLISVTVIGRIGRGKAVLRSGARPGDILFTSGCLGEAEFGLRLISGPGKQIDPTSALLRKHLYPEPRLVLGSWLAEKRLASAMMDLSDGLSTDLPRLCASSKVGSRIYAQKIPKLQISARMKGKRLDPLELALHGGDDYELLFTVPRRKINQIPRLFQGLPITPIGEITKRRSVLLIDENGREVPLANRGWDPFRNAR